MSHHDVMGVIGKMWQDMSDADKAVSRVVSTRLSREFINGFQIYNNAAASAKEQYSQKKQAYAARSPEEVAAANALAATVGYIVPTCTWQMLMNSRRSRNNPVNEFRRRPLLLMKL